MNFKSFRIDNLQYCNWSKNIFQINNEAKLDAIHVTIAFIIAGFIAIYCIIMGHYWLAAFHYG